MTRNAVPPLEVGVEGPVQGRIYLERRRKQSQEAWQEASSKLKAAETQECFIQEEQEANFRKVACISTRLGASMGGGHDIHMEIHARNGGS